MRSPLLLAALTGVLLTACQHISPSDKHPILHKTWGPNAPADVGEAIAVKADRRVVNVILKPKEGEWPRFCAEPAPDVAQNLTSALNAAIQGTLHGDPNKNIASGTISNSLTTTIQDLFRRTQGVQLARDGLYGLCQLYVNGALTGPAVEAAYTTLIEVSADVIKHELGRTRPTEVEYGTKSRPSE